MPEKAPVIFERLAQIFQHAQQLAEDPKLDPDTAWYEAHNLLRQGLRREVATLASLLQFAGPKPPDSAHEKILAGQVDTFDEHCLCGERIETHGDEHV